MQLGPYALTLRTNMIEVLGEDYIRAAQARGLSARRRVWKHGLRNAILPALTLMGLQLGTLVGGAVLTETVFAFPGVGRLIYEAVGQQDYPVIQGAFIMLAVTVVIANALTDMLYAVLNPGSGCERAEPGGADPRLREHRTRRERPGRCASPGPVRRHQRRRVP